VQAVQYISVMGNISPRGERAIKKGKLKEK
jgi:hypothetical protein